MNSKTKLKIVPDLSVHKNYGNNFSMHLLFSVISGMLIIFLISVPPWATGSEGCILKALPFLTIIYLPEQTAVELTADCGSDGTRRIACKGKAVSTFSLFYSIKIYCNDFINRGNINRILKCIRLIEKLYNFLTGKLKPVNIS